MAKLGGYSDYRNDCAQHGGGVSVFNGQLQGQRILDADLKDFAKQTFGYSEVEVKI